MKILLVGQGAREASFAWKLAQDKDQVFAVAKHANPSLVRYAAETGGAVTLGNPSDPATVVKAAQDFKVDLVFVSADDPLAAGVIDALTAAGIACVGPTKAGAEIEWSKSYCRTMLADIAPFANPDYVEITNVGDIDAGFARLGHPQVAIKPIGLTGGKGVKVMGPHLADMNAAKDYARDILTQNIGGSAVIIEEKLVGSEFTLQGFTDGTHLVLPRGTCDYPYRYDADQGPKTGGMGTYSTTGLLPYLNQDAVDKAAAIMQLVLTHLRVQKRVYTGALYGSFFALPDGRVKVVEFNARYGDPEGINIMCTLNAPLWDALLAAKNGTLEPTHMVQKPHASVLVYLVAPDYALPSAATAQPVQFNVDVAAIENMGCTVLFGSAVHVDGNTYQTVGSSRTMAVVATDPDLEVARVRVYEAIAQYIQSPLQFRGDIASADNIKAAVERLK